MPIEILDPTSFPNYLALLQQGNTFAKYKLAVPSGCTAFSLFGSTAAATYYNHANPLAPSSPYGSPTLTTSAIVTDTNDFLSLGVKPLQTSETIMFVASSPTAPSIGQANAVSGLVVSGESGLPGMSTAFNINTCTYSEWENDGAGVNFAFGLVNAGAAINAGCNCSSPTGTPDQATLIRTPQFYVAQIDMVAMSATIYSMTPGGNTAAGTAVIPAGATRYAATQPYRIGTWRTTSVTTPVNTGFFAQFSRITTPTETAAVYTQVQRYFAALGVTI